MRMRFQQKKQMTEDDCSHNRLNESNDETVDSDLSD